MNLYHARVLIAAQYAAPYEGNFVASLNALSGILQQKFNASVAYVFPQAMADRDWAAKFIQNNNVYLTGDNRKLVLPGQLKKIVKDFNPTLVYTHFEGYDIPLYKATRHLKDIHLVWHMHDTLSYCASFHKAMYQRICYFLHYGFPFIYGKSSSLGMWGGG